MKILVLGNSHGVDSSTMLAKIYMAEKPAQPSKMPTPATCGMRTCTVMATTSVTLAD